jgi:hypothetical protein
MLARIMLARIMLARIMLARIMLARLTAIWPVSTPACSMRTDWLSEMASGKAEMAEEAETPPSISAQL